MNKPKVIFMGTPIFATNILKALIENTDVVLVVSQKDKYVGRKHILTPSPVKELAMASGIEVFTPDKIRDDYEIIERINPDLIVTCAYGQILPEGVLNASKIASINVHASLLPKYRGGAPIHRAIMNGETETGITIMYMDKGMDSGDIIKKEVVKIEDSDNLETLSSKLSQVGSKLLIDVIPSIMNGTNERIKQNEEEVSFANIIKKEDELLDFNKTSREVFNHIRALNPSPGAYFTLGEDIIKVYESRISDSKANPGEIKNIYKDGIGIGTMDGEIVITKIKPAGKKIMLMKDYLNGVNKKELIGRKVNERES